MQPGASNNPPALELRLGPCRKCGDVADVVGSPELDYWICPACYLHHSKRFRAVTLSQPWATLLALGVKTVETRAWTTAYTGPLLIHAARKLPEGAIDLLTDPVVFDLLRRHGVRRGSDLPLGKIVGYGILAGCQKIDEDYAAPAADTLEALLGDYTVGRHVWQFRHLQPLAPIPATGYLGLWTWEPADQRPIPLADEQPGTAVLC